MNSKKILIADDDDGIRYVIATLLQDHGFVVLEARDETELLSNAKEADLWIIDVRLPTRGYEGILAVHTLHSQNIVPRLPILFISVEAEAFAQDKLKALENHLGIKYEWLDKPFEFQLLLERVKELVKHES